LRSEISCVFTLGFAQCPHLVLEVAHLGEEGRQLALGRTDALARLQGDVLARLDGVLARFALQAGSFQLVNFMPATGAKLMMASPTRPLTTMKMTGEITNAASRPNWPRGMRRARMVTIGG